MKKKLLIRALYILATSFFVVACYPHSGSEVEASSEAAKELFSIAEFEAAKKAAESSGKLLVVDFKADWCGPCKMMDKTTWKDPSLIELIEEKAVPIQVDVDKRPDLASKYGIEMLPTIMLIDAEGKVVNQTIGYQDAKAMIGLINDATS